MKIAVILANYNHAAFITQAFEGVLSQTYQNWRLWVVDDGSTDESWSLIERYRDRDSRIIIERFPQNRGFFQPFAVVSSFATATCCVRLHPTITFPIPAISSLL